MWGRHKLPAERSVGLGEKVLGALPCMVTGSQGTAGTVSPWALCHCPQLSTAPELSASRGASVLLQLLFKPSSSASWLEAVPDKPCSALLGS